MTDQLDADLRAMLTQRATDVAADVEAGEHAIATRLEAGDVGLADVVAIRSPRRAPLLVAAAVLLVIALGAAALLSRGDDTVDTGPAGPATTIAPTGTPTTTTTVPSDDPTAGTPDDSAKDVVERFARDVLAEEWVATGAEDRDDATFVTFETEAGVEVVARLEIDLGIGAYRLTDLASPGLTATETDGDTFVMLPVAGSVAISGFDERLVMEAPYVTAGAILPPGSAGPYAIPDDATAWLSILVQTEDGTTLRLLSRR
jgi:hypothetical protein